MNYFAHALPYFDRPYMMAGTAIPDWMAVADRSVRVRTKHAEAFLDDPDPETAAVARGVLQHLRDDAAFHGTRPFAETSLALTVQVRDVLEGETGMRPAFLGHLLTEVLLDASLIADDVDRVDEYYRVLGSVDAERVEAAFNRMAPNPTRRLAVFIELFLRERILRDYLEDAKLWVRLNQVMRRVRQQTLPERFMTILPAARRLVDQRRDGLLAEIDGYQMDRP